jgi:hypothetical protein
MSARGFQRFLAGAAFAGISAISVVSCVASPSPRESDEGASQEAAQAIRFPPSEVTPPALCSVLCEWQGQKCAFLAGIGYTCVPRFTVSGPVQPPPGGPVETRGRRTYPVGWTYPACCGPCASAGGICFGHWGGSCRCY